MRKEIKKAPTIRFRGFTEDWEQRKLSNLAVFSKGSGYSKNDLVESGTPIILYGRLYTRYETRISNVDTFVNALDNSVYSEGGEVIVPASGETAEDISRASVVGEKGIILGGDLNILMPRKEIDSVFLALTLSHGKQQRKISKVAQGKTIVHIHNDDLRKVDLLYPANKIEQKKIGQYFLNLDNLITLHQRKFDELKTAKTYFLQNMFPAKGEKVPRIRFHGFTGDWEQRKLGDVAEYRNGKAHENEIDDDGEYIVVNSKFVSTNGEIKKFSNAQNEPLYENEIAFVLSDVPNGRAIARTFLIDKSGKYTLNQRIAGITPHEDTDPYYLHIKMNRNAYFLKFDDGNKQTNLSIKDVLNYEDMYPNYKEQQKIGNYFHSLDHLITLHQRKIDQLQTVKKFMLQNLFI